MHCKFNNGRQISISQGENDNDILLIIHFPFDDGHLNCKELLVVSDQILSYIKDVAVI